MPFRDLLEYSLASGLHHISMAGDDTIKVPFLDLRHALVKSRAILGGLKPQRALLPGCGSVGVHDAVEELGKDTCGGTLATFAELFGGREVEEQIRFNERSAGLVVED